MLTRLTQTALAVWNDIACMDISLRRAHYLLPGRLQGEILADELTRPASDISLLDVFKATGEHLNCNHEVHEEMYHRYGVAAHKLGVVNHMTRQYLSEIKLTDL